jgi:single-strand DNA-binding protein
MNLNLVQLIGRATRDPELKALPSGVSVCSFSIATNRYYTSNNEKKEETEFHNIVAFGKLADIISQYIKKGSLVYIQGRMVTRSWVDKTTNEKKYRGEIIAEAVQLPPKGTTSKSEEQVQEEKAEQQFNAIDYPEELTSDGTPISDIPF